ncbi:hypothetical protein GCM10027091_44390 [Streptomyces daliensis]
MATDQNSAFEVLHNGAWRFVTPFQEWHNERVHVRTLERASRERELATQNSVTAILVKHQGQRKGKGEFEEDFPPPAHEETCGFGPPRPVRICMCRRGEHE